MIMYYNYFRHYILICLLNQIILKIFVCAKTTDYEKYMLSETMQQDLAHNVCLDLEYNINVSNVTCQSHFWDAQFPPKIVKKSSVKIRCTTPHSTRFLIQASKNWQMVLMLPDPNNDIPTDMLSIIYSFIEPKTEYGMINTELYINYTMWSTELVEGAPVQWVGGDKVSPNSSFQVPEYKKYKVDMEMYREKVNDMMQVNSLFIWNTTGDGDVCFDVVNICGSKIKYTTIWPNQKSQTVFTNLPLDEKCIFTVKGLYGSTRYKYQTPSCKSNRDCVPEIPQNVTIRTIYDNSDTWTVLVRWLKPHYQVEGYNVTIHTHNVTSQIVDGNKTEAVFKEVVGDGIFSVSMYAILGRYHAHTSRRAMFAGQVERAPVGRDVLAGAAGSALLLLAALCTWRRRRRSAPPPHYPSAIKVPIECNTEAVSTTSECCDSWEINSEKLLLHEVIGEGAFGVVRRATLTPNGINVAVKMLKDFPSQDEIRSFRTEMEMMKSVGVHPHLVSLVGCCSGWRPLIVAEYCSRGDLLTYLRCTWDVMVSKRNVKYYNNNNIETSDYRNDIFNKCKTQESSALVVNKLYELEGVCDKELTSLDLLSFCRQIAMGMEFLALNRVVHRDLAARNVLVTADRTLKIADFGLSRDVYEDNQYKQKGNGKIPVKWMAPESLTRRVYTTQSDVWSFGVVVWEVATLGASPYASVPAARLPRLLRAGYRMPRPANCSQQLYDIMCCCWRALPRERPTFAELHARLDELVQAASAHHYLPLELDPLDAPPTPTHRRYFSLLIRGKRKWSRAESYERPLRPSQSNHYTSPPVVLSKGLPL